MKSQRHHTHSACEVETNAGNSCRTNLLAGGWWLALFRCTDVGKGDVRLRIFSIYPTQPLNSFSNSKTRNWSINIHCTLVCAYTSYFMPNVCKSEDSLVEVLSLLPPSGFLASGQVMKLGRNPCICWTIFPTQKKKVTDLYKEEKCWVS